MGARSAADFLPAHPSLKSLREAVQRCRGCDLHRRATQAVPGEGLRRSRLMLVGEMPGDREDREGRPFVGPAGGLLDRALADARIERRDAFVTNAVKHFKWKARGKRRLHQKPDPDEVRACRPWLEAEIEVVEPEALVALGATAAKALFGTGFRVTRERGRVFDSPWAELSMGTVHPSAILRLDDESARRRAYRDLVRDLRAVVRALKR